jgi:hypothetical protein
MARELKLEQIGDWANDIAPKLVKAATLYAEEQLKLQSPVGETGNFRNGFETQIGKAEGVITNKVVYAEPLAYGTNRPPSWVKAGVYGSRQTNSRSSPSGWVETIAKNASVYAEGQVRRLSREK